MIGLLSRVVIGVVVVGIAGGVIENAPCVYKRITRALAKSEIKEKTKDNDVFKNAFKAKVKSKKDETVSFTVMDKWDEPLGDLDLFGDDIDNEIKVGDEIILIESY